MNLLDSFIITCAMYTIIPMPRRDWSDRAMRWTMAWFPAVGLIIGGGMAGLLLINLRFDRPGQLLTAVLLTLWPILLTGGLHYDGFADTADALGSHRDRETRLRIMKDPTSGPAAIVATATVLLLQLGAWFDLLPRLTTKPADLLFLSLIPVMSRVMSGLGVYYLPPARRDGLVRTFRDRLAPAVGVILPLTAMLTAAAWLYLNPLRALAALVTGLVCFIAWMLMCKKLFGGVTGDLAGFLLVVAETAFVVTQSLI